MEINNLQDLQQRRAQLRLAHLKTEAELTVQHKYLNENKFSILWDTVSPFGPGEQNRSRVMSFIKSSILPMLGTKGMILNAILPSVETFVSKYAVKGFKNFISKFKKSKPDDGG
ncbi:MAG: hypothetical protein H7296_03090 [Bacteroidia bacterium]|nr:hypothetical protein [Bacteroidia bacterium]